MILFFSWATFLKIEQRGQRTRSQLLTYWQIGLSPAVIINTEQGRFPPRDGWVGVKGDYKKGTVLWTGQRKLGDHLVYLLTALHPSTILSNFSEVKTELCAYSKDGGDAIGF